MADARERAHDGERVRRLRETLAMTQRDLADEWGVGPATIAKWELGTNPVPGPVCKLLDIYEQELSDHDGAPLERRTLPRGFNGMMAFGTWVLFRYVFGAAGIFPSLSAREVLVRQFSNQLASHRGLLMKLGQSACFLDPLLPESERAAIAQLRERAKPMTSTEVVRAFREAFGTEPRNLYSSWSARPYRCGSVGQIHRAEHEGRPVAVKVQYPRARESLQEDLRALQSFDKWLRAIWPAQTRDVVFDEAAERFLEECDFTHEAETLVAVAKCWAGDPRIVVPLPIPERTRGRVLTMEWCAGRHFDDWLPTASRESRRKVAETIWEFYVGGIYRHGRFNADPHPGNLLIFPDDRVGFVDFGREKVVSERFRSYFTECTRAVLERDWSRVWRLSVDIGLVTRACEVHQLARHCVWVWLPNLVDEMTFTRLHCMHTLENITLRGEFRKTMTMSRDSVFVHQLHLASYSLLASLDVRASYRAPLLAILYPNGGAPAPFTPTELAAFGVVSV